MDNGLDTLLKIAVVFSSLSLVSIGGGNTVLPEIHRAAVHDHQWMTDQQFADIYAISEAAPGPSSMISSLVGLKAGGLLGAIVTMVALYFRSPLFQSAIWRMK